MGILGDMLASVQDAVKDKSEEMAEAAMARSADFDSGWSFQMKLDIRDTKDRLHGMEWRVKNSEGDTIYRIYPSLLNGKKTVIKDSNGSTVASLKEVSLKGYGVRKAFSVWVNGLPVGRLTDYKPGLFVDSKKVKGYHLEPLGYSVMRTGKVTDFHYEVRDASGNLVAISYRQGLVSDMGYRINYNDLENRTLYLALLSFVI